MLQIRNEIERGCLLIASPLVPMDQHFIRSVVLITDHDSELGSSGFVLNRPLPEEQQSLMSMAMCDQVLQSTIYSGGPVGVDQAFCLIDSGTPLGGGERLPCGLEVTKEIFQPENFDDVLAGATGNTLIQSRLKFFRGYAGWSPGQLTAELEEEIWLLVAGEGVPFIFSEPENLWSNLLLELPESQYHIWSQWPVDCRIN